MQINGNFIPRYVTINEKGAKAMKNIVKYGIIICTCLLISPYSLAKTVIKEDVKYNLNDKKMTAVYEEYVGNVELDETEYVFPREVSVEGRTYVVDEIAANAGKRIPAKKLCFRMWLTKF